MSVARRGSSSAADRTANRRGGAVIVGLVLLLIGVSTLGYFRLAARQSAILADVPAVLGLGQSRAESLLHNADLVPRVVLVRAGGQAAHTIIQQIPAGGELVRPGSAVTVEVNIGPAAATVPRGLLDRPVEHAEKLLDAAGFTDVVTQHFASRVPGAAAGAVTAVEPGEGRTVPLDARITITSAIDEVGITIRSREPATAARPGNPARPTTGGAGHTHRDPSHVATGSESDGQKRAENRRFSKKQHAARPEQHAVRAKQHPPKKTAPDARSKH